MEISFSDLRSKIVINLVDGRKLGHIIDIIFEQCSAKILGIIVPGCRSSFSIFKAREDIFIPYHNIYKIGEDTILVQLPANVSPTKNCCFANEKPTQYIETK